MRFLHAAFIGLIYGMAIAAGIYLTNELTDPYSDIRLWLATKLEEMEGTNGEAGTT